MHQKPALFSYTTHDNTRTPTTLARVTKLLFWTPERVQRRRAERCVYGKKNDETFPVFVACAPSPSAAVLSTILPEFPSQGGSVLAWILPRTLVYGVVVNPLDLITVRMVTRAMTSSAIAGTQSERARQHGAIVLIS